MFKMCFALVMLFGGIVVAIMLDPVGLIFSFWGLALFLAIGADGE